MASTLIRPFRALRPSPEQAADVIAPPYDVLNSEEAKARASGRPASFLHISKPEIDLPAGTDPYSDAVYEKGKDNLDELVAKGVLIRDSQPCYYVYRIIMGDHAQTGLACVASIEAYRQNRVRKHELTRPTKETDRVRQIAALNAQTGPVFLAHRQHSGMSDLLASVASTPPLYDVTADDGVTHQLWMIEDLELIQNITNFVEELGVLYIADGHHRSAAASRVASEQDISLDSDSGYFLTVTFPQDELQILDYNRVIMDLYGLDNATFLEQLGKLGQVDATTEPVKPRKPHTFGFYLGDQWYSLSLRDDLVPQDPVDRLDVSLLHQLINGPILSVGDPRTDPRIDFVGGIRGLGELKRRVDEAGQGVAFALYPTSMEDLMAVADAEALMPPKSTWFEPKLADGLLTHVLD